MNLVLTIAIILSILVCVGHMFLQGRATAKRIVAERRFQERRLKVVGVGS
jgi:hypothetical protein